MEIMPFYPFNFKEKLELFAMMDLMIYLLRQLVKNYMDLPKLLNLT
jgi:hypothetical protein